MFVFECGLLVDTISIGLPSNFTGGAGGSAAQVQPRQAQDLRAEAARELPGGPAAGARPRVPLAPRQAEGQGRAPGEGARQRAKVRGDQSGHRLLQQQQPQRPPRLTDEELEEFVKMFPNLDRDIIASVHAASGGDKETMVNNLLQLGQQ